MARTKASVGAKVSMGKSSKARSCAAPSASNSSSSGEKSSRSYSGGNPVHPRETPKWQKPITTFVFKKPKDIIEDSEACSSKTKPKRQIIYSDEESDSETKNNDDEKENNASTNEAQHVESQLCDGRDECEMRKTEKSVLVEKHEYGGDSQDYDVIESPPKNRELDESITLEPLTGENSHKLEEYFSKTPLSANPVGKLTNKQNLNKVKRTLDDAYEESPNKRIRIE